jgi:DNA-binding transcriptional LysR family regulator
MTRTQPRRFDRHLLDGLGALRAVVEAGSFVGAGEALGLTQSAVSRVIARVEDRVGVRLFRRTARSIALTDEGLRFFETVAPHLAAIEDATIAAAGARAQVRGRLRVNIDERVGQFLLTPNLGPFLARYPDLAVELAVRDRMGDLVRDGFDVAVRFGVPEPSALRARLLLRTRVITCAAPAYLARRGTPRRPRDVEEHPCILMRDPSTGAPFGWEFVRGKRVVAVNATGQLVVNGTGSLMAACLAGLGVAQVIELYAREHISAGRLVQVLPAWADETYPLHAYHHAAPLLSARVRAFLDFVAEVIHA